MIIRPATDTDWPAIEALNKTIDYGNPASFMRDQIQANRILVAELQGEVVGYALWQTLWGNTPFLALVKVFPTQQKKGIGTQLIAATETMIREAGFKVYLSSSMAENPLGKSFHDKLNFKPIGMLNMPHGKEVFYQKNL